MSGDVVKLAYLLRKRGQFPEKPDQLLIITILSCLLAIAVIIVIRQHLKRTRRLNQQVTDQNTQMKEALSALEQSQVDNTRMMQIVAHDLNKGTTLFVDLPIKYDPSAEPVKHNSEL